MHQILRTMWSKDYSKRGVNTIILKKLMIYRHESFTIHTWSVFPAWFPFPRSIIFLIFCVARVHVILCTLVYMSSTYYVHTSLVTKLMWGGDSGTCNHSITFCPKLYFTFTLLLICFYCACTFAFATSFDPLLHTRTISCHPGLLNVHEYSYLGMCSACHWLRPLALALGMILCTFTLTCVYAAIVIAHESLLFCHISAPLSFLASFLITAVVFCRNASLNSE